MPEHYEVNEVLTDEIETEEETGSGYGALAICLGAAATVGSLATLGITKLVRHCKDKRAEAGKSTFKEKVQAKKAQKQKKKKNSAEDDIQNVEFEEVTD